MKIKDKHYNFFFIAGDIQCCAKILKAVITKDKKTDDDLIFIDTSVDYIINRFNELTKVKNQLKTLSKREKDLYHNNYVVATKLKSLVEESK